MERSVMQRRPPDSPKERSLINAISIVHENLDRLHAPNHLNKKGPSSPNDAVSTPGNCSKIKESKKLHACRKNRMITTRF
jgi:hypothetical protein